MGATEHYTALFAELVATHGPLDDETISSIIGFSGGGPVSMCQVSNKDIYVTCELSSYPEQVISAEGFRFELLSRDGMSEDVCSAVLTALGNLSMTNQLGHGHTVDVSQVSGADGISTIALRQFSTCLINYNKFGIYEVVKLNSQDAPKL